MRRRHYIIGGALLASIVGTYGLHAWQEHGLQRELAQAHQVQSALLKRNAELRRYGVGLAKRHEMNRRCEEYLAGARSSQRDENLEGCVELLR